MAEALVLTPLYPEMEEATIGQWRAAVGDAVSADQPLAELITEKVVYELTAPTAGTLLALLAPEKSVVPVGTVLAVLGDAGETVSNLEALQAENRRLLAEREAMLTALHTVTAAEVSTAPVATSSNIRATPAARRLARERGLDLATLTGSGPGGMITVDDIPG